MTAPIPALPLGRQPPRARSKALRHVGRAGLVLWLGWCALVQAAEPPSEEDFFASVPEVLTVTRLSQSLADTPGSVTVIDRETIARSGARDLADVLRLVPGYLVSGWNGANPGAAYHVPLDEYGVRNLVLVNGRSVYSPFLLGGTHRGMMGVMLEDVERIEVLRGANSAAYGANAMYGVINVITRHSADTQGAGVSLTTGVQGIRDAHARVGWGDDRASYRLSVGQRNDHGYEGLFDDRQLHQLHFRGDIRPSAQDELQLDAGLTRHVAGEGFAGNPGNPERTVRWRNLFLHGQWRRQLSATEAVKVSASVDQERLVDTAPYTPIAGVVLDSGGRGRRLNLEFQHQLQVTDDLRGVWGLGWKQDSVLSRPIYFQDQALKNNESRAFGNLEWRASPKWLVNAGLFLGDNSWTGTYVAPRLMVNHHFTSDHTLRAGITRSIRSPSLFELASDVRYYDPLGNLLLRTYVASGNARPERLDTRELSYYGHFRDARLVVDVRAYHERMRDLIEVDTYNSFPQDHVNKPGLTTQGLEYQLRWSPREGTQVWFGQNLMRHRWAEAGRDDRIPPTHTTSVAWFQKLAPATDLTLALYARGGMTWRRTENALPPARRLDLRLAHALQLGNTRAQIALTVQALNGDQQEFVSTRPSVLARRTFLTLDASF